MSAYWAAGGTALLDTVGGEIERRGRERSTPVVATLWAIVVLKLIGAATPLIFAGVGVAHLPTWTNGRRARLAGWTAAIGLTLNLAVLTAGGLLVEAGVVEADEDADQTCPRPGTHTSGSPWFALWGAAFVIAMWRSHPQPS